MQIGTMRHEADGGFFIMVINRVKYLKKDNHWCKRLSITFGK